MSVAAIQFRPFFKGRDPLVLSGEALPGATGAEDLVALAPIFEPISAGRPPVAPDLVTELELPLIGAAAPVQSGWRVTRSSGTLWGGRVVVDVQWTGLEEDEWALLRPWLVDVLGLGGDGGSELAFTIDVDGEDVTDSQVEVRAVGLAGDAETLLSPVSDEDGLYSFVLGRCEEVL